MDAGLSHVIAKALLAGERFSDNFGQNNSGQNRVKQSLEASLLERPGFNSPKQVVKANNAIANGGTFRAAVGLGLDKKYVNNQLVTIGNSLNLSA